MLCRLPFTLRTVVLGLGVLWTLSAATAGAAHAATEPAPPSKPSRPELSPTGQPVTKPKAPAAAAESLGLEAFSLSHQPASEAVDLVRPLLSRRGNVELQVETNTVVVRETPAALARIVPVLRAFDHPAQPIPIQVQIVRGYVVSVSPMPQSELSGELVQRLRGMLRYQSYLLLARAELRPREGEEVGYELGQGYRISFRLGTVLGGQRIRLHGLRVVAGNSGDSERELIHTTVNLRLDQPLILGLVHDEESDEALFVILDHQGAGR